jgi:hypothetical protein
MSRLKTHTLVVPMLGGVLLPTPLAGALSAARASARRAARHRRRDAQHAPPSNGTPNHRATGVLETFPSRRLNRTSPVASTKRQLRRRPRALFSIGAVGVALVVAGCGSAAGSGTPPATPAAPATGPAVTAPTHKATPTPTPTTPVARTPAPKATSTTPAAAAAPPAATSPAPKAAPKVPATAKAEHPDAGIPQGNGGDADPDNNAGPNDGDGAI